MDARLGTFETLRRREHGRRLSVLRQRLPDALGGMHCSVYLFASLARGDWDGFSDTDLLVVAASRELAEQAVERLERARVGDDVLALDQGRWQRWQAMDQSPSPHWRAIGAQALRLYPAP